MVLSFAKCIYMIDLAFRKYRINLAKGGIGSRLTIRLILR
jgi:hypothetical protein